MCSLLIKLKYIVSNHINTWEQFSLEQGIGYSLDQEASKKLKQVDKPQWSLDIFKILIELTGLNYPGHNNVFLIVKNETINVEIFI